MLPSYLNQSGYTSCMKLFGIPILPPLVTNERRKELNGDKQKAIEIEKRLKGKRSSIDSGVMTGSYTDNFRSSESQQTGDLSLRQLSIQDLTSKQKSSNITDCISSPETDSITNDTFLKSALEDPDFREFFASTAERIFKENKIELTYNSVDENNHDSVQVKYKRNKEVESQTSEVQLPLQNLINRIESFESFLDNKTNISSVIENDINLTDPEKSNNTTTSSQKESASPPPPRVRRNSYTLESPSPVLLEHMAKEIARSKQECEIWHSLSDQKEKKKGLDFKTFSVKNQRKHWNKNISHSPTLKINQSNRPINVLKRSKTFIKSSKESKMEESIYSLPTSSQSSPSKFPTFTRSVDCITTLIGKTCFEKGENQNFAMSYKPVEEINVSVSTDKESIISDGKNTVIIHKTVGSDTSKLDASQTSLINNSPTSTRSNCGTENSSPPQYEFSDSASQISVSNQSTIYQPSSVYSMNFSNRNNNTAKDREETDDTVSLCSSISLPKFLQSDEITRPSTAEEAERLVMHQLQMKHEKEIRELIERQEKEKLLYSHSISNSGSQSSRTNTNLSIDITNDLYENQKYSDTLYIDDKRNSCSRELFPLDKISPLKNKALEHYSEKAQKAAFKLTACVRGYLTRRLLKTEKMQQLVEIAKESLNYALSLQAEPCLKRSDLDLHERLANQTNVALQEFHKILYDAPVATRMAIIATDRERLRKPPSRPSSAISSATRKSLLRRQQSLNSGEKKSQGSRTRTKSLSTNGDSGSLTSRSYAKSDSSRTVSEANSRSHNKPWR